MKKLFAFALVFFAVALPAHAETAWRITNFSSDIVIEKDGSVQVVETIDVVFSVEKHGIFRDIPIAYQNEDGSEYSTETKVVSVTDGVNPILFMTQDNGANMRIKIGDAGKTVIGKQKYVITYVVKSVLRPFDTYDELYWNVTGDAWDTPIDAVSASVTLPENGVIQTSCYYGAHGSTMKCRAEIPAENTVRFSHAKMLAQGEEMTIAVGFTKGIAKIQPPIVTKEPFSPIAALLSFLVVSIGGIASIVRLWWKKGRDKKSETEFVAPFEKETIIAEYESPLGLRPGELGALIDETADTLDITATIIDLASRGYLKIEELPSKWFFGGNDYELTKTEKKEDGLLEYETKLLDSLFKNRAAISLAAIGEIFSEKAETDKKEHAKNVKISELKNSFYKDLEEIKKALYEELTRKKLFDENPSSSRGKYSTGGAIAIVAGFGMLWFSAVGGAIFLGAGGGLILCGIIFLIAALKAMPRRTALGHDAYIKALGYKLFVSGTEKYRAPFYEKENLFMEVLPYAIVFGVTKKLAEAMKEMGLKPAAPSWYHGAAAFNASGFTSNMGEISKALSSAIASAPGGSGSGGGGFSGGGHGGGGGGSW